MKFQLLTLLQEIHAYLLMKGTYVIIYEHNALSIPCAHRQRVESSFILSSQISTDSQRRVFLGGDTIKLTFNIGMV